MPTMNTVIIFILNIIRIALWVLIFITLFGISRYYLTDIKKYSYLSPVVQTDRAVNQSVKNSIPTKVGNTDMSRAITIIFLIILSTILTEAKNTLESKVRRKKMRSELELLKNRAKTVEQRQSIDSIEK